ncbi:MAG: hypothetical protein GTO14_08965 [Anaerolineales bacterium]|nr:hypothetical protein [Anaerolineales bacterium]
MRISIGSTHNNVISTSCLSIPRLFVLVLIFAAGWVLSGCSRSSVAGRKGESIVGDELSTQVLSLPPSQDVSRVDRQGAVEVAVTPLDTNDESERVLLFEVSMNTHSVDLSMDLARLSTLTTDLGLSLDAESWTGGSGHHVRGLLSFSMYTPDGTSLVVGARELILTIRDVDVPERVFVWQVSEIP